MEELDHSAQLLWAATISEGYLRLKDPDQSSRLIAFRCTVQVGPIVAQSQSQLRGLDLTSSTPLIVRLSSINVSNALEDAATALDVEAPQSDLVLPPMSYVLAPVSGKVWADVSDESDLVFAPKN